MRSPIDKTNFTPSKRGSYYTITPNAPQNRLIFLHGSSQSAEAVTPTAIKFSAALPNTQVIVPNGYVDNYDPAVSGFRKAERTGQKFDWQFFSDKQIQRYEQRQEDDNPFYSIEQRRDLPTHIAGFSAGAFGALKEYIAEPQDYQSITLIGYHFEEELSARLKERAKDFPAIIQKPILHIMGKFDPLMLFNKNARISEAGEALLPSKLATFAGRQKNQEIHEKCIKELRETGFSITERFPTLAAHNMSNSVIAQAATFISLQSNQNDHPTPAQN